MTGIRRLRGLYIYIYVQLITFDNLDTFCMTTEKYSIERLQYLYDLTLEVLLFVGSQSTMYHCGFPEQVIKDHVLSNTEPNSSAL